MTRLPIVHRFSPESENLSLAWSEAFLHFLKPGSGNEITPLIVNISDFDDDGYPILNINIQNRLDLELRNRGGSSPLSKIEEVASTIFPQSLRKIGEQYDAKIVFDRYEKLWPKIENCHGKGTRKPNGLGVYFRRMIAYQPAGCSLQPINQIEWLINALNNHEPRRAGLQLVISDPTHDTTVAKQRGFPCLQQIAIAKVGKEGLMITGIYPMQLHFEKAYGNYLGLCRLGKFIADQTNRKLVQMTCFSAVSQLSLPKKECLSFAYDLENIIKDEGK